MTALAGDTYEFKRALRRELRRRRASVSGIARQRAAHRATALLTQLRCWRNAQHVGMYLASGSELPTAPLLARAQRDGKHVYVPQVGRDGAMRFIELAKDTTLRRNRYGILEPSRHRPQKTLRQLDLLIVPLVGFDAWGFRLGAGGGYYDRCLARRIVPHPLCLGWALALQEISAVPRDPWDRRLDGIVTERGLRWPTG